MAKTDRRGHDDGDVLLLVREMSAIADARHWVGSTLRERGLPRQCCDDAVLVISELVTNAVRHGDGRIVARVHTNGDEVTLSVSDEGTALPELRHVPVNPAGGLGLQIVDRLATRWGVESAGRGKTVWAVLGVG